MGQAQPEGKTSRCYFFFHPLPRLLLRVQLKNIYVRIRAQIQNYILSHLSLGKFTWILGKVTWNNNIIILFFLLLYLFFSMGLRGGHHIYNKRVGCGTGPPSSNENRLARLEGATLLALPCDAARCYLEVGHGNDVQTIHVNHT